MERERELDALECAWREAADGRGSLWLLCAEAGGGKTRLAREIARYAGSRLRWGAAEPVSPPEPFLAVCGALRGLEPAPSRAETVQRVTALLTDAEGEGPVLLVLDDLHYADDGTIAVLVRLARECATRRWLVIAAFRPDEAPPSLRLAAGELVAHGSATRLDLPPLSREGVVKLVASARPAAPGPADAVAIWADSGGNPWFAEALARGDGAMTAARDRITLRLDRLQQSDPHAVATLKSLAPATRSLSHSVVARLRGGDTPALRRTLALLRDAGLLREQGGAWGFGHELLRRSLLEAMIGAERRDAHRALAGVLEGEGSAAEVAMHYAEAGDPRAVDWSLRAAREARGVDAHSESLEQFRRALAFPMEPERRRSTLREAALEAYDLARFDEIRGMVEEALAIPGGEPAMLASLHQLGARVARNAGDLAADEAHLDAAERLLRRLPPGPQLASVCVARMARAAIDVLPLRLAAAAERAMHVARQLSDPSVAITVETQVKSFQVIALLDQGNPAGLSLLDNVLGLVEEHGLPPGVAISALANGYEEAVLSLFLQEAESLYARAVALMRRHQFEWMSKITPHRALALVQCARYTEADDLFAETPDEAGDQSAIAVVACAKALREARAGTPERARAVLSGVEAGRDFQSSALLALAALELAQLDDGAELGELAQGTYCTMNRRRYARVAGEAAVALARARRGAAHRPGWLAATSPLGVFWDWAAALDRGDADQLRTVAVRLEAMACPYEAALALRDAGDLAEAYRRLRAIDATTARERVAERLRAAHQPIPRRTRAAIAVAGLTDAERAVCRLVAAGRSNGEIATELGISPRTVGTHLTRIYDKTGQRGRTVLALWWSRQGEQPES